MNRRLLIPALLTAALAVALAIAGVASGKKHHPAPPVHTTSNAKLGTIVVNRRGMTLYHLTGETTKKLMCTGACLGLWPPASAKSAAGSKVRGVTVFRRSDNHEMQLAYKGEPLYTFANDHRPGDTNGQGFIGKWFAIVVKKKAAAAPAQPAPASPTMGGYGY